LATLKSGILGAWEFASPAARQTAFLFGVDSFTNLVDYGFHVYLSRALLPGQFAVVQAVNAVFLILVTAFGVMQPVMARFVAEAETGAGSRSPTTGPQSRVIFQRFFRFSAALGLLLVGLVWLGRHPVGQWLNVPPAAVGLGATMILLALLRPVVGGMLQGQQRFVAFGSTRSLHALGRFAAGVLLISLGGGTLAAIAAFPIGGIVALLGGLLFLGWAVWRPGAPPKSQLWRDAFRLSAAAFIAFAAYMSMINSDLIWVNRSFSGETAGAYATAVLLRRVMALLPGAVLVVMYPRVVARVTSGQLPDSILWKAAALVSGSTVVLTGLYVVLGPAIIQLAFGQAYVAAAPLLGWMGVGMLGYGLGSIWMNLYLATRPLPFVGMLAAMAVLQHTLLASFHQDVYQATAIFVLGGWVLALGGLLIYLLVLRPRLVQTSSEG
jgi:O-antigen/teichoic acid export membrane protein